MKISIVGNPIAKARPRFCMRGKFAMTYDSQSREKKFVQGQITAQIKNSPPNLSSDEFYNVKLVFYLPITKKSNQRDLNSIAWGFDKPNQKPDLDNLEKFILDCANGILFHDDSQIIQLSSKKEFSSTPRTEMEILTMQQLDKKYKKILSLFSNEEIKQLQQDVKSVYMSLFRINEITEESNNGDILSTTACLLNSFAKKWANKLNKISKL